MNFNAPKLRKDPDSWTFLSKAAEDQCRALFPEPRVGQLYTAVWSGPGQCTTLDKPTLAKDIICPRCGGKTGYTVRGGIPDEEARKHNYQKGLDRKEIAWSCNNGDCINYFASRTPRIPAKRKLSLESIGIPVRYLDVLNQTVEQNAGTRAFIGKYASDPLQPLVISGPNGTGKTHIACWILASYVQNHRGVGRFWNMSTLNIQWRSFCDQPRELLHFTVALSETPLLVLDDVGIRCPTDAYMDFIYQILNNRDMAVLPTIMTTNLKAESFAERFGNAILSRINGYALTLEHADRRAIM